MNDPSQLFTLRFRLPGGLATITAWEAPPWRPDGKPWYPQQLARSPRNRASLETHWGAVARHLSSIDGDSARALVCSLFAMRPGDTDDEYFESYTQEQLDWAERFGEELALARDDRYGEDA